jgi:hypothetical protein
MPVETTLAQWRAFYDSLGWDTSLLALPVGQTNDSRGLHAFVGVRSGAVAVAVSLGQYTT